MAHSWDSTSSDDIFKNINLSATKLLIQSSREAGVSRFIFASSQSSRKDALNLYGRLKWEIEAQIQSEGLTSARIGLVYSGSKSGQFRTLARFSGLPLLPVVGRDILVQPISMDELSESLYRLVITKQSGVVNLSGPEPIKFGLFLKRVALVEHGKSLTLIPLPLDAFILFLDVFNKIPFVPKIDPERLLGLQGTRVVMSKKDLLRLGVSVSFDNYKFSTSATGKKGLLIEGRTILKYLLKANPPQSLIKNYANALARKSSPLAPIGLPWFVIKWPGLLMCLEPIRNHCELKQRIVLASTLVEFSEYGNARFFSASRGCKFFIIITGFLKELLLIPIRFLLGFDK